MPNQEKERKSKIYYQKVIDFICDDVVQKLLESKKINDVLEDLKVTRTPYEGYKKGINVPNADLFCYWLETFGGKIWLPGDPPPGLNISEEKLWEENENLKKQVADLSLENQKLKVIKEYLESKLSHL